MARDQSGLYPNSSAPRRKSHGEGELGSDDRKSDQLRRRSEFDKTLGAEETADDRENKKEPSAKEKSMPVPGRRRQSEAKTFVPVIVEPKDEDYVTLACDDHNRLSEVFEGIHTDGGPVSKFEEGMIEFGRHASYLPPQEAEPWPEEEEKADKEEEEVVKEGVEEDDENKAHEHIHSSQRMTYDDETATKKTAVWEGMLNANDLLMKKKYDMGFLLDIEPDESIIASTGRHEIEHWIKVVKSGKGENAFDGLKGTHKVKPLKDSPVLDPQPLFHKEHGITYEGETNVFKEANGKGTATYKNGDTFTGEFRNGYKDGHGKLTTKKHKTIASLEGDFVKDHLEGIGIIVHNGTGHVEYAHFCGGVLHGLAKTYDKNDELVAICYYQNGHKIGYEWQFLTGGSYLLGTVDEKGNLTGDHIAYLYPDLMTSLLGKFENGKMIKAQACFVESGMLRKDLFHLKFTTPKGPFYKYDPGTEKAMGTDALLLQDPYEYQCVFIKQSRIKGAQEGLHSCRDLYKGEIVSFYNGIKVKAEDLDPDISKWEQNAYKIMDLKGKDKDGKEWVIDIAPEAVDLKVYAASLSHKANHSFEPNAKFTLFQHPRFGLIPSIVITADAVAQDGEVTVAYDYAMDEAPPWYQDLYTKKFMDDYKASKEFNGALQ